MLLLCLAKSLNFNRGMFCFESALADIVVSITFPYFMPGTRRGHADNATVET